MSSKINKLKKLGLIDSTTHSSITERIKQIEVNQAEEIKADKSIVKKMINKLF